MKSYTILIYKSFYNSKWYWRIEAANGRVVADGAEGYVSKGNARRAINRLLTAEFNIVYE